MTACNPRELPWFKQESKRQDERITEETKEAIRKSPELQKLIRVCLDQIPRPGGFELVNMSRDFNRSTFLSYGYHSSLDFQAVKHFYTDYFAQHDWKLISHKDSGWGPSRIEFQNADFKFVLYDMGRGEGENYGIVCGYL